MGLSWNVGIPIAGWFILEHLIQMDDWGTPIFGHLLIVIRCEYIVRKKS